MPLRRVAGFERRDPLIRDPLRGRRALPIRDRAGRVPVRAAYERVEATARDYAGDLTRAADALRREIDAERAREMDEIEEMKREVLRAKDLLERERLDFDARRAMQEDELTRAYDALRDEREAFERERSRVEGVLKRAGLDDDGKSIPIAKHVREKYPEKCA